MLVRQLVGKTLICMMLIPTILIGCVNKSAKVSSTSPVTTKSTSSPASVSFQAGVDAYKKEEYLQAITIWKTLAESGSVAAQYNLGQMYVKGEGVGQDFQEAAKWYTMAAESGDAEAQYSIGLIYRKGHGVIRNKKTAMYWWSKAAAQSFKAHGRGIDYQPGIREQDGEENKF